MNTSLLSSVGLFYGLLIILVTFMPFMPPAFGYVPLLFIAFLIVLNQVQIKKNVIVMAMIYMAFMLISNLFAQGDVRFVSVLGSLSILLLAFRVPVGKNIGTIILACSLFLGLFIIAEFFLMHKWHEGVHFIRDRLWLAGLISGWPNFAAIILATGVFLSYFKKSWLCFCILFIALFLTTSRLFYEVAIFIVVYALMLSHFSLAKKVFIIAVLAIAIAAIYGFYESHIAYINNRLLADTGRHSLYQAILERCFASVFSFFFGAGNISYQGLPLDIQSAHNSYLNILYRNGFVCLLSFLVMLCVNLKRVYMEEGLDFKVCYMLFFIGVSLFNNYFFNGVTFSLLIMVINMPPRLLNKKIMLAHLQSL